MPRPTHLGIRLRHPTLAAPPNGTLTYVVELDKPFANDKPRHCNICSRTHGRKSVHLNLDEGGYTIVSPAVFESLKEVFLAGFEVANEVRQPRTDFIGAVAQKKRLIVTKRLNRHEEPDPFYRDQIDKYESQAKMASNLRKTWARLLGKEDNG